VLEVNGMRHPLNAPGFVIGRGTDADVRINDPGISRQHAEVRVSGTGPAAHAEIVDLGSTNGILVNGHKVQRALLAEGTRIEIGSTRMLVHTPAGR
jgi:pSer/pThr/pTyr-binding forkhead associated (FHA) protein